MITKKAIFAVAIASLMVASTALAGNFAFTSFLKTGSTGSDVSALQEKLVTSGFLTMPAGVSMGYFGQLTKAAVVKYQASVSLPATGFVGPLTVAQLNGTYANITPVCPEGFTCTAKVATVNCPTGYTCVPANATSTVIASTSTAPVITTNGVEGILTVTQGAVPNTTVYEGDSKVAIMSLQIEAQMSDLNVQRVQLDLGSSTSVYTKSFRTLYVMDDSGNVLATKVLNSDTVVRDGNDYVITISGFNYLIKKDATSYLTIAADLSPSIDSIYKTSYDFTLPDNGIRATDGAGIDQRSGGGFVQTISIDSSLVDSASLKISTKSTTPDNGPIIANSGSNKDQSDKVTVLVFNVKAEDDVIGITDVVAKAMIDGVANKDVTSSAYLYDGSDKLISTAAFKADGTATFANIGGSTGYKVAKDTTSVFTLKIDVRKATEAPVTLTAAISGTDIRAENSEGMNIPTTGSATSNNLYVQKAGPVFTLVGSPEINKSPIGQTASSTFLSAFTFDVNANGTDVSIDATNAIIVGIYVDNVQVATSSAVYAKPTSGITGTGPYTVSDGSIARFVAEYSFNGPEGVFAPAGHVVSARLEQVNWNITKTSTYMSDTFRTNSTTL